MTVWNRFVCTTSCFYEFPLSVHLKLYPVCFVISGGGRAGEPGWSTEPYRDLCRQQPCKLILVTYRIVTWYITVLNYIFKVFKFTQYCAYFTKIWYYTNRFNCFSGHTYLVKKNTTKTYIKIYFLQYLVSQWNGNGFDWTYYV